MGSESAGEWLARQMERRDISVGQVADALDVTTKTVYYWRGDKTEINEERVPRLAEVLGVSELEARRGLGFWVPEDTQPAASALSRAEAQAILDTLDAFSEQLEALRRRIRQDS